MLTDAEELRGLLRRSVETNSQMVEQLTRIADALDELVAVYRAAHDASDTEAFERGFADSFRSHTATIADTEGTIAFGSRLTEIAIRLLNNLHG